MISGRQGVPVFGDRLESFASKSNAVTAFQIDKNAFGCLKRVGTKTYAMSGGVSGRLIVVESSWLQRLCGVTLAPLRFVFRLGRHVAGEVESYLDVDMCVDIRARPPSPQVV